jgi:phenylacetate-CoA ligase
MSIDDRLYPLRRLYEGAPQIVKTGIGLAYRQLPPGWRHGRNFGKFAKEATESENWTMEARTAYQTEAVRRSLRAAAFCPYYQRRFLEHGVDPLRFEDLSELAEYPMLSKEDLILHRDAMLNQRIAASSRLYMSTGGSSGVPVGFYLHKGVSRAKEQAYLEAQWRRRGYQSGDPMAVIRGAVTSRDSDGSVCYYDASRNWLVLSSYHLTRERFPEYLRALNRFKPKHLHAYPSAALALAREMVERNSKLEFHFASILCGSEKLSPESQTFLETHFEAPVFHWYGHSERVVLAGQGRRSNHLYFWPGYGYVEFGPPNETSHREIIGTSFHNDVMPLIRYRTGDFVKIPDKIEGELPMTEVGEVVGREYEFLVSSKNRRVSLTAINMHDDVFEGLLAVQFFQSIPGLVEFRYQPGANWRSARLVSIRDGLNAKLGEDFELKLVEVKEVEKTAAGKHCWLLSRLGKEVVG